MAEQALLKEQLNITAIAELSERIIEVYPEFDGQAFAEKASTGLTQLELKARVSHIIDALAAFLPQDFCQTARIIEQLADNWNQQNAERNWTSYAAWPVIDYVSVYGLAYPQRAFSILEKLTPLFTAEFAIRAFVEQHFDLSYQQMLRWAEHEHEHVRRLASEGLRPRLPWAAHISTLRADPSPLWPLLNKLKADPSGYVRRSVANNLNDISKDHPEQVLAVCNNWQQDHNKDTDWVIRHGLRTLVKSGVKAVYPLLGFTVHPQLSDINLTLAVTKLAVGQSLEFKLDLVSEQFQHVVIDYRIGFARATGQQGYKVFKWKNTKLEPHQPIQLKKTHSFKPISTRRYYPGTHTIEVLLNGSIVARATFELTTC